MRNMQDRSLYVSAIVGLGAILITLAFTRCSRARAPEMRPPPPPVSFPGWGPGRPAPRKHYLMVEGEQKSVISAGSTELSPIPRLPNADPAAAPFVGNAVIPSSDPLPEIKPYRTWIQIQRYQVENSGDGSAISNVKLVITFPGPTEKGTNVELPGAGQYWAIGNGQVQEIARTFELPWKYIQKDGFRFRVQMVRKGAWIKPCEFDVAQLSQFNRSYVCRTDVEWQKKKKIAEDRMDKESLQIRVLTDRELRKKDLPTDAVAIAP